MGGFQLAKIDALLGLGVLGCGNGNSAAPNGDSAQVGLSGSVLVNRS